MEVSNDGADRNTSSPGLWEAAPTSGVYVSKPEDDIFTAAIRSRTPCSHAKYRRFGMTLGRAPFRGAAEHRQRRVWHRTVPVRRHCDESCNLQLMQTHWWTCFLQESYKLSSFPLWKILQCPVEPRSRTAQPGKMVNPDLSWNRWFHSMLWTPSRASLVKVTESNILFEKRAQDSIFKEDHGNP